MRKFLICHFLSDFVKKLQVENDRDVSSLRFHWVGSAETNDDISCHSSRNQSLHDLKPTSNNCWVLYTSALTPWGMKFLAILFTPANMENERRVGAGPEVVTLGPAVKMKPQTRSLHSHNSTNTNIRWVLGIDCFQFHVLLESTGRFIF